MGYLLPTDYATYGLPADTTDDWITTASALIDSYCHRTSLNPTQYEERLRLTARAQTVRLSYLPLVTIAPGDSPLISIQARYSRPRRGEMIDPAYEQIAWVFGLPGSWSTLNLADVDFVSDTGELTFPTNILGLPYNEVDVTYTAIGNNWSVDPSSINPSCA